MHNEEEIISKCIKNDRKAQKMLYNNYAPGLLGVCIRFTGNRQEAEDILQEGFVKIFLNIIKFEGRSSLASWMRRIMVNTAITLYHKNLKHQYHQDIDDHHEEMGDNTYREQEFTREELMNVISGLPAGYRMVFNLYAIEGYKHREIAEIMEIDTNTSKSQYSRARKIIQSKLQELKKEKGLNNK